MEGFWGHVDGGVFNVVFVMIFLVDVGGDVVERYVWDVEKFWLIVVVIGLNGGFCDEGKEKSRP